MNEPQQGFECLRCGTCCTLYNATDGSGTRCPYLMFEGDVAVCSVYENRPEICKTFPDPNKGEKCQNPKRQ